MCLDFSLFVFGLVCLGFSLLPLDYSNIDSLVLVRSPVRSDLFSFLYGMMRSDSFLPASDFAHLGFLLLIRGLAHLGLSLLIYGLS